MPKPTHTFEKIDQAIQQLWKENDKKKSTYHAIDLANQILQTLGIPEGTLKDSDLVLDEALPTSKFSNQKMETWFEPHFRFTSARLALNHFDDSKYLLKSRFYQLNESSTKARISASTQIDDNWEDSELTRKPEYKVGIDFFLNADANALLMVVSNYGNLRVLELTEKISHTQVDIFNKLIGLMQKYDGIDPKTGERIEFEPQKSIHKSLWDALALETVNKNFYEEIADLFNELQQFIIKNPPSNEIVNLLETSKIFSIRILGRVLFTWFLRKKKFISAHENYFEIGELESTDYYEHKLKPLFFETFNQPIEARTSSDKITPYLNGGLFSAHEDDLTEYKVPFPKSWFNRLYEHLYRYNFTIDESSPEYEQVAIDPEMLGRVFENLLASVNPETAESARKEKGAFYTPRSIVSYMCKISLKEHIITQLNNEKDNYGVELLIEMNDAAFIERKSTGGADLWGTRTEIVSNQIIKILDQIKILDPAVGSGAFPIGIMQLMIQTYQRLNAFYDENTYSHRLIKASERNNPYLTKLSIIQNNLFGVDIEPMAVELSRLRTWLTLIIDETEDVEPLPNLELSYVCANSLVPLQKEVQMSIFDDNSKIEQMSELRESYFKAHTYKEKEALRADFDRLYLDDSSEDDNDQTRQLKTWNPFAFKPSDFFDSSKMFNQDGFDLIIGNPPYIDYRKFDSKTKEALCINYELSKYSKKINLYLYFFELGFNLLKRNGFLAFITPQQYLASDSTLGFRLFMKNKTIIELADFSYANVFTADTYPIVSIFKNSKSDKIFKYKYFSDLTKLKSEYFINFSNPLDINFRASQNEILLKKIENNGPSNLLDMGADVFVASSTTHKKSNEYNSKRIQFIEASDILHFKKKEGVEKYIEKSDYSINSLSKQRNQGVIFTSRMTSEIRSFFQENNKLIGGKVNVIKDAPYPKLITCLLNSQLINFWFKESNRFMHLNGGALPINTTDLLKIPLPKRSTLKRYENSLSSIYDSILDISFNNQLCIEMNKIIYEMYSIDEDNQKIIENYFGIKRNDDYIF